MGVLAGLTGNARGLDVDHAQAHYSSLLLPGEVVHGAFHLYRDVVLMTDRRYIEIDSQGVTGRKTQYLSVPWGRISAFAVETVGIGDLDSELKLWISGVGPISSAASSAGCSIVFTFNREVDAMAVERVLADHLCPPVAACGVH